MATLIRMPEIAANATHAVLIEWLVKEGATVQADEVIATIETDKATVDLNAARDGTVGRLLVSAGAQVEVGAPVAVLLEQDERAADIEALLGEAKSSVAVELASDCDAVVSANDRKEGAQCLGQEPGQDPARDRSPPGTDGVRIFASPLARRLAHEKHIPLADLQGSGPYGRIVKMDIERHGAANPGKVNAPLPSSSAALVPDAVPAALYEVIPHTGMRKTIARRLTESKHTIPHFYLRAECRMDALLALRSQVNHGGARKLSINDFIIKAVACSLRDIPDMAVIWTDEALHRYRQADIAVAVSTPTGLITPVIHGAERKSLSEISTAMAELAHRARASRLLPHEYQGGTFAISNLGMYGVIDFTAIINPPQSAILAVGSTRKAPIVVDDAVDIASVMQCTLSVDHRAIDGTLAAKWLALFKHYMESPVTMLI